nr:hypothetical protein [Pseudenhygromyxa sp. WMMC2535]
MHTAIFPCGAAGLRFVGLVTLDKGDGHYVGADRAPDLVLAWIPRERISDEASSPEEVDAALAQPDQIPLLLTAGRPVFYVSDAGAAFPSVGIKGAPMILVARLSRIIQGTHGQLTFGWEDERCR